MYSQKYCYWLSIIENEAFYELSIAFYIEDFYLEIFVLFNSLVD